MSQPKIIKLEQLPPSTPLTNAQRERAGRLALEAAALVRPQLAHLGINADRLVEEMCALRNNVYFELGGPVATLVHPRSGSRRRRKAALEIANKMSTRFASPRVRAELRSMTPRPGGLQRWVREEIFVPALLEATQELRRPQTVRLGTKWITDAKGRKARLRPVELDPIPIFKQWLMTRARALAEERILGGQRLKHLSQKQRELLLLLQSNENYDYAHAADRMGVTAEAVRQLAARARAKALHETSKRSPKRQRS